MSLWATPDAKQECIGDSLHGNLQFAHGGQSGFTPPRNLIPTSAMIIALVHVHVKPECVDAFKEATLANATASVQEAGIARFDFYQQQDDPNRFVLVEAYSDPDAPGRHKETAHYAAWRDAVTDMMVGKRFSVKYSNVFPDDAEW